MVKAAQVRKWALALPETTEVDPDELHDLISGAWRHIAPKRLVKTFDAAAG